MGDTRWVARMMTLLENLSRNTLLSIPNGNNTWVETYGGYRFFDNENVNYDSIMFGHQAETLKGIQKEPVVLIPQVTTFLNFATDHKRQALGTLRCKKTNQQLLYTSIALSLSRGNLAGCLPVAGTRTQYKTLNSHKKY